MNRKENLRALAGICEFHSSHFWRMRLNRSLIPKTSAHFNVLRKTSLSPRATASKANNAEYCYGDC